MSLLNKLMNADRARVEARAATEAEAIEAFAPTSERRGANQLVVLSDQECPHCGAATVRKRGTNLWLWVCIKCRIALAGEDPAPETANNGMDEEVEEKVDWLPVQDCIDDNLPDPEWLKERKAYEQKEGKPIQTMEDQDGDQLPAEQPSIDGEFS